MILMILKINAKNTRINMVKTVFKTFTADKIKQRVLFKAMKKKLYFNLS